MDGAQSGHQDEAGHINSGEQNERADFAHGIEQEGFAESESDPSTGPGDVEVILPAMEMTGLELQQTRAGSEEQKNPEKTFRYAQMRMKQLGRAEPEQNGGEEIRRGPDHEITNAGEDGTEPTDEIL